MERIPDVRDKPLTELLEETDLNTQSLDTLAGGKLRGKVEKYPRKPQNNSGSRYFLQKLFWAYLPNKRQEIARCDQ